MSEVGRERRALLHARDLTISIIGGISLMAGGFLMMSQFAGFPPLQAAFTMAALPLLIPILWFRGGRMSANTALIGLVIVTAGTGFSAMLSDARLSGSTNLFILGYLGLAMFERRWHPVWISSVAATWCWITPSVPLWVELGGYTVNLRWSTLLQLLVSLVWFSSAWTLELQRLDRRDALTRISEDAARDSITLRERTRVWRQSLVHIHETVLNDIRAVLDSGHIDARALESQVHQRPVLATPPVSTTTLRDLLEGLASGAASALIIEVRGMIPRLNLAPDQATAVRAVLLELVRNLERHTEVTSLEIRSTLLHDTLDIRLFAKGDHATVPAFEPGIGARVVIDESIQALGASLQREGAMTRLVLPLTATDAPPPSQVQSAARTVLATATASNALGGALALVALALTYGPLGAAEAAAAALTTGISIFAVARQRVVTLPLLVCAAAAATAVPLLASRLVQDCANAELPVMVAALTSMALAAAMVWASDLRAWPLSLGCGFAMTQLASEALTTCTRSVAPPLLASMAAPLLLVAAAIGLRAAAARERSRHTARVTAQRSAASMEALRDVSAALQDSLERAVQQLLEVAEAGELAPTHRKSLRCLDAEIRALMQVDPESAGSFALTALAAVQGAVADGQPVRVLALRDSGDRRALPDEVVRICAALLASEPMASIQALCTQGEDLLVVTTHADVLPAAGLHTGWRYLFDDGDATLDVDEGQAVFLVHRRVAAAHVAARPEIAVRA